MRVIVFLLYPVKRLRQKSGITGIPGDNNAGKISLLVLLEVLKFKERA
jgi:hypothetical protein